MAGMKKAFGDPVNGIDLIDKILNNTDKTCIKKKCSSLG